MFALLQLEMKVSLTGVQQLAKIKHPRVLSLQHPLEESR